MFHEGMPKQPVCHRWKSGFGCDRARCSNHHNVADDILNECHRYQRGQPCHTNPCYRLHVQPGSSSSSSTAPPPQPPPPPPGRPPTQEPHPDAVLAAVRAILAKCPEDAQCRLAKKFLVKFHQDHNPEPELQLVFRNTVLFLTDMVNKNR